MPQYTVRRTKVLCGKYYVTIYQHTLNLSWRHRQVPDLIVYQLPSLHNLAWDKAVSYTATHLPYIVTNIAGMQPRDSILANYDYIDNIG